jgi:hypothetical protein
MKIIHLYGMEFVEIFPANEPHYVLDVLTGDGSIEPIKYRVLFWALEAKTLFPYPVTLEGVQTDNVYILEPCGKVERPGLDGYANMDEWFADQKKKFARRAAQ